MLGVVGAVAALVVATCMPSVTVATLGAAMAGSSAGAPPLAHSLGPSFANASMALGPATGGALPIEDGVRAALTSLMFMLAFTLLLLIWSVRGAIRATGRAVGRAASAACAAVRAMSTRILIVMLVCVIGPQQGATAISPTTASRLMGLLSAVSRSGIGGRQVAHAAGAFVHNKYDLAFLPDASADTCLRLGRDLGLPNEPLPVMNAASGSYIKPELGTSVRPRGLHLADSGAGIHAVNDMQYVVPGSLRTNTTAIATANGVTVPPHRCDAALSVRTHGGSLRRLLLNDAILLPECQHSLVSLGLLARDEHASTVIGAGADDSYIELSDGTKVVLINSGVMVLPDSSIPVSALRACRRSGDAPPRGHAPAGTVTFETIHNRFNGRAHQTLRHLATAVRDVPRSWLRALARSPEDSCEACLRARADKLHSN